jgi:hypothetical protein
MQCIGQARGRGVGDEVTLATCFKLDAYVAEIRNLICSKDNDDVKSPKARNQKTAELGE